MTKECLNIDELKIRYEELKQKYNLPDFNELNKIFDIEDVEIETDFLLRKIRRIISEKISGYLRFVEVILNPSNAPIFFFKLVKKLDNDDKTELTKIYEKLGNSEIQIVSLDINYSEKNEADFIIEMYNIFNKELKEEFIKIVEKLKNGEDNYKRTNGSYFG